jgi:hypothetical protein
MAPLPPAPPPGDADPAAVDALLDAPLAPPPAPPFTPPGAEDAALAPSSFAAQMVDLARQALVRGDVDALERWTQGLRAAGEHDRLAERIDAIARLARGQVGEALRALRDLRAGLDRATPPAKAQASLALGLALAAANRPDEALLAGLDALARAREGSDARATAASLAFLAKLYGRVERTTDAAALRAASGA